MDVEWAIDGLTNDLLLCKHVQKQLTTKSNYHSQNTRLNENRHDKLLLKGIAVEIKLGLV
jgi:hypothetical protein